MTTKVPTTIQEWFRDYSDRLSSSFRSSGRFRHAVTKGQSREHQILDILSNVLPTKVSVDPNVVIVDSTDHQSPKFDGALVNSHLWPRLFVDGSTSAVMIESVLAALETKSSLGLKELKDVFEKAER